MTTTPNTTTSPPHQTCAPTDNTHAPTPTPQVVIDISKHAVLGKFNDIRPGIYRSVGVCLSALYLQGSPFFRAFA
jgi:hypothetical protein